MGNRRKEKKPFGPVVWGLAIGVGLFLGAVLAHK